MHMNHPTSTAPVIRRGRQHRAGLLLAGLLAAAAILPQAQAQGLKAGPAQGMSAPAQPVAPAQPQQPSQQPSQQPAPGAAQGQPQAAPNAGTRQKVRTVDSIVAVVNNEVITNRELEDRMAMVEARMR
ncbi:MAG: SurA N-terminal domain, partial [Paucimonas sp.]|nr:SurA N-terminal domain [Paucimonas sp.]